MTEQEALAVALAEQELVKPVNDILMIDPETRTINVPDSERLFGVQSDEKAERKYFKCPNIVGNNAEVCGGTRGGDRAEESRTERRWLV